jgi:uncharacterized protein (TIGR00303 family)
LILTLAEKKNKGVVEKNTQNEGSVSMFFLIIGSTDIARVPGLSAAGANADVLPFTAPADADVARFGYPVAIDCFPMDPEGHPTPALITRAAAECADIPLCVVRAGTSLAPAPPYVELSSTPGSDPRFGNAVPDARKIFGDAASFAKNMTMTMKRIMIAESIPGGTTTALLALRALGYDCMVSSASNVNPTLLKEKIWGEVSAKAGIKIGDLRNDPLTALEKLGDPMQAATLGFIAGVERKIDIVLAGGTQMLAIAACLRALGDDREITVATTKYVGGDNSTSFGKLASELKVNTYIAPLDFSDSPFKGLRDYEAGYVKEGVGAGGSVLYASWSGVGAPEVIARTNELYRKISAPKPAK